MGNQKKRRLQDEPSLEELRRVKQQLDGPKQAETNGDLLPQDEAGSRDPSFAPGDDADYFIEEDEEGRFFGGGLTDEQKQILNIFDNAPNANSASAMQEDGEELNIAAIRRILNRFERAVDKNQDHRSKFPNDPSRFIDSEADLDAAIKSLLPLSQVGHLAFPEMIRMKTLTHLTGLLSHENADIALDVIELLNELTDEDVEVDVDVDNDDEGDRGSREEDLIGLIDALLSLSLPELLSQNLPRLKESEDPDRQGVFHILGILENVLALKPEAAIQIVNTSIMQWMLQRTLSTEHDANRAYAAELLSILLQASPEACREFRKIDGVDTILQACSRFRLRDPIDADEVEFMDNLFDSLCSSFSDMENRTAFTQNEGVDLMVLMMNQKLECRSRAVKVLDYALATAVGTSNCTTFVEASGLKPLFQLLSGSTKAHAKSLGSLAQEDIAHCLGIISSLLTNLLSESIERIRLIAKFVGNNYSVVDRLAEIRESAWRRLIAADKDIALEKQASLDTDDVIDSEHEESWYLRRLDSGLFSLQLVDYVIAWIVLEDDGIRAHIETMLSRNGKSLKDVKTVLEEQVKNMDESAQSEEAITQRAVVQQLAQSLEGV